MFFRDEGEMGDVLDEAESLLEETRVLKEKVQAQIISIVEHYRYLENVVSSQTIKKMVGEEIGGIKDEFTEMVKEWDEKKDQLKKKEEEITRQQQLIQERETKIECQMENFEIKQKERISKELHKVSQLSTNVEEQLSEVERIKNIIDNILSEDGESIEDKLFSKEDVEFLRLNYFSLMRSRLTSRGVVNPLTKEEYNKSAWEIDIANKEINARIIRGMIKKRASVGFNIKFIVPEDEEGFIYRKIGKDVSDVITGFLQPNEDGKNSFNALVLISPTGWSEWIIDKVINIRNINKCVYLVDLCERNIFFNNSDTKTKLFVKWFLPVSLEEEIESMVENLEEDIKNGVLQFRVDKIALQYKIPRKIVISAFKEIVNNGKGEFILPDEGAKDVILVVR